MCILAAEPGGVRLKSVGFILDGSVWLHHETELSSRTVRIAPRFLVDRDNSLRASLLLMRLYYFTLS